MLNNLSDGVVLQQTDLQSEGCWSCAVCCLLWKLWVLTCCLLTSASHVLGESLSAMWNGTCDWRWDSPKEMVYKGTYGRVGFWGWREDGKLLTCWNRNITSCRMNMQIKLKFGLVFNLRNRMMLFWKDVGNSAYTLVSSFLARKKPH